MNEMIDRSFTASEVWFREGLPVYWDSSNVIELGLENNHRFNQTKMNITKTEIGYDRTKTMIGLGGYEYNFTVYNMTNDTVFTFGLSPSDTRNLIKIERIGIYGSSIVKLEIMVWG